MQTHLAKVDDLVYKIGQVKPKVFSLIDFTKAFHQLQLYEMNELKLLYIPPTKSNTFSSEFIIL